jgi:adenylate kinase family enzyme
VLGPRDQLPRRPRRVLVAGVSGVGKSTLAGRIGAALDLPYTEIDALYHGPNWQPREQFETDVAHFTSADTWVTEWQYSTTRALLAQRADTLVWLDLPAAVALWRVVRRTWRRSRSHEQLWNGNAEPGMWHALTNREGIIVWAIRTRRRSRLNVLQVERDHPHLQVIRLRRTREVDVWLSARETRP